MSDPSNASALLSQVLAKLNALPDGAPGNFAPVELQLLRAFIAAKRAAPTEREHAFIAKAEAVLRPHAAGLSDAAEEDRRKNALLRTAIDKCQLGQPSAVTPEEHRVLSSTAQKLASATDLGESHLRLRRLVNEAMAAFEAEATPPVESPLAVVKANSAAVESDIFFQGGTRTRMREYGEIPIETNARVIEHAGNLEINGNVPDDVTLVVTHGGVVVNGQCDGNVLASGSIDVRGNIAGTWTVSLEGSIQCERVLGGANVIAPQGAIRCTSLERPGKLVAGDTIHVEKDARGGVLVAPSITVDGTMRGTETQILKSLVCGTIVGDARETAQVTFRNSLSSEDYRVSLSEETLTLMREATRFRFREAVGESIVAALQADFCGVQCARIYGLTPHEHGLDLPSLRSLQARAAFMPVAVTIGGMLEQVVLEAIEFDGDAQTAALHSGTDECQQAVKFLEREAGYLSDDLTRDSKAMVVSACKHLINLAKKVRECSGQRAALEEAGQAVSARMAEWREAANSAAHSLQEILYDVRSVIGDAPVLETDTARLNHLVATAVQAAGGGANTMPMRAMKTLAERYVIALSHYVEGAAEVKAERMRIEEKLVQDPSVQFGGGRLAERYARATVFGPHVVLATSPGLAAPPLGGPEAEEGRCIRVDRELPGPATFVCDGLSIRRTML